jgi:hypothetical protein
MFQTKEFGLSVLYTDFKSSKEKVNITDAYNYFRYNLGIHYY